MLLICFVRIDFSEQYHIVGETRDHIVGETRDRIVGETREVHFVQNTSDITCLSWICQSDLSDVNIMSW
jgi:hypothetical protein